jgi:hypothetical protein
MRVADANYSLLTVGLPKKEMARRIADDGKDHSVGMYRMLICRAGCSNEERLYARDP